MKIHFKNLSLLIVLSLAVLFSLTRLVWGWTGPSSTPPSNNTSAPLNVSGVAQSKSGGLLLNTGGATNALIIPSGNVGIGLSDPGSYRLNVNGNVRMSGSGGNVDVINGYLATDNIVYSKGLFSYVGVSGGFMMIGGYIGPPIGVLAQNGSSDGDGVISCIGSNCVISPVGAAIHGKKGSTGNYAGYFEGPTVVKGDLTVDNLTVDNLKFTGSRITTVKTSAVGTNPAVSCSQSSQFITGGCRMTIGGGELTNSYPVYLSDNGWQTGLGGWACGFGGHSQGQAIAVCGQ